MKRPLYARLGFELVFATSLIAVFILPAIVYAQEVQKRTEIIIKNGDTTVNGKKMKDMTAAERKDAQGLFVDKNEGTIKQQMTFTPDGKTHVFNFKQADDSLKMRNYQEFKIDTLKDGTRRTYAFSYRGPQDRMPRMKPDMRNYRMPMMHERDSARRNTFTYTLPDGSFKSKRARPVDEQNFNFNNVDKYGITTNIHFRVSNADGFDLKQLGVAKTELDLKDLGLSPEFSTGKVWLMFGLENKMAAAVQFSTADGKVLWTDKVTNGNFSKNFSLPANGVYLLKVQQGSKTAVKRIVKE